MLGEKYIQRQDGEEPEEAGHRRRIATIRLPPGVSGGDQEGVEQYLRVVEAIEDEPEPGLEFGWRQRPACDPDPFGDVAQVWRCEQPCSKRAPLSLVIKMQRENQLKIQKINKI